MKQLFAGIFALLASIGVNATDYNIGQCPVATTCSFSSLPINASSYSDTLTFFLGDWGESYGTYQYASTNDVEIAGANGITPCSGRGCHGAPYAVTVKSATLDGVPMTHTQTSPHDLWFTYGPLLPGSHVVSVTGSTSGATWYGRWSGAVQGVLYTLTPSPPPPPCTGCG